MDRITVHGAAALPEVGPRLLAVGSCALMAVALVFLLVVHVRLRARGPLVRLDAYGVTVAGGPATPWSDLSGVRRVKGVVLMPQTLDATGPQILAAVQRFGRIPHGAC
ncbi:hypothetical protein ACIGBH_29780 [Streptomyces sp. NPDC085929]|uniref:hypothetical protein n=1 Tax=Streptomyces sp. NPDC085929 TaxID=3365739 RepID=UPI0037D0E3C8